MKEYRLLLKENIIDVIMSGSLIKEKILNKHMIEKILKYHLSSKYDFSYIIWYIYIFQNWHNTNKPSI